MNKRLGWVAIFALAVNVVGLRAAGAEFFPPGDAAWTVEIERGGAPVSGAPYAVKYDIQRIGGTRVDRITFSNGQTTERWWALAGATFLLEKGLNGAEYFYSPNEGTAATAFDASMFRWMKGQKPVDEERWKGKACLVFGGEVEEEHGKARRKAWVDKETGRVRGLEASGNTYVFTFHEKVADRLDPPPTLLKRAERARRMIGVN
jgi:hypothetical protein